MQLSGYGSDGEVTIEASYKNGKRHGTLFHYRSNGDLLSIKEYDNGRLMKTERFD